MISAFADVRCLHSVTFFAHNFWFAYTSFLSVNAKLTPPPPNICTYSDQCTHGQGYQRILVWTTGSSGRRVDLVLIHKHFVLHTQTFCMR